MAREEILSIEEYCGLSRNLMWTIFKVYIYSNIYLHLYTLLQFSTAYCCFYVLFVPTKSTQKPRVSERVDVYIYTQRARVGS